ncbi:AraC family transcriptional regulator [Chryseobacterium sp. SG20098]|uniref:helix-turn-helix domain-containing protein n=1 Tax=Chryseobacterium sp. SG20098 TaxID=3074145 RepID=UPI0028830D49|nr:AraC family transcriptional regulator [Chryseobacterium sp. SG20098]WNI34763.1 AraC family transcriptional regulator [Chryseobacterium sp. SG20098]
MKIIFCFFVFFSFLVNGQEYSDYRVRYDNFEENDERALEFVNAYIKEAKVFKNYKELTQAYRDAVSFSRNKKIEYADSAVWAASQASDPDLIGNSYLTKGSVYYFTYRKYQKALDEYLRAWQYLSKSKDPYLYYKNMYHIGVVKSYLGYYEEAFTLFSKCLSYYRDTNIPAEFSNLRYNMKKGYLNSLHQMAICLFYMKKIKEVSQLINEGLQASAGDKNFYIERSYFYKLSGILAYLRENDKEALYDFNIALAGIEKKSDFTNTSLIYYLKGKILLRSRKENEGMNYLEKVDSIFLKRNFAHPSVREVFELLITHYKDKNDNKKELYYTKQLLQFDQVMHNDFKYLSGKIIKEYDTNDLLTSKKRLESSAFYGYIVAGISFGALLLISVRYFKVKRRVKKYQIAGDQTLGEENHKDMVSTKLSKLPENLADEILDKLKIMEQNKFYLEKGLTQNELAKRLKTNTAYLSAVINEYKGTNYNTYLNNLRIEYVKEMLRTNAQWRKYSIDIIAYECRFSNRSHFAKIFTELTTFSPLEFIQKIKDETGNP